MPPQDQVQEWQSSVFMHSWRGGVRHYSLCSWHTVNASGGEVIQSKGMETREIHICKVKTNTWETYLWRDHRKMLAEDMQKSQSSTNISIDKVNEWMKPSKVKLKIKNGRFYSDRQHSVPADWAERLRQAFSYGRCICLERVINWCNHTAKSSNAYYCICCCLPGCLSESSALAKQKLSGSTKGYLCEA